MLFHRFKSWFSIADRRSFYLSNKPNACAVGIGSVESSFLIQNVPGVDSFEHPDYPPLLVFAEYLCALEVSRSLAVL